MKRHKGCDIGSDRYGCFDTRVRIKQDMQLVRERGRARASGIMRHWWRQAWALRSRQTYVSIAVGHNAYSGATVARELFLADMCSGSKLPSFGAALFAAAFNSAVENSDSTTRMASPVVSDAAKCSRLQPRSVVWTSVSLLLVIIEATFDISSGEAIIPCTTSKKSFCADALGSPSPSLLLLLLLLRRALSPPALEACVAAM